MASSRTLQRGWTYTACALPLLPSSSGSSGGKLTGYLHQRGPRPNNSAVIVAKGLGHDFCLIDGRWLVDFWAWTGHCLPFRERDLYDLQNPRDSDRRLPLQR